MMFITGIWSYIFHFEQYTLAQGCQTYGPRDVSSGPRRPLAARGALWQSAGGPKSSKKNVLNNFL